MNSLDFIILAPIIFGIYKGYTRGFVLEIIMMFSFVLAVLGGFKMMEWGMNALNAYFDISGNILPFLSFILIFIAIIVGLNVVGKIIKRVINLTILGVVDNLFGAIFSGLKWIFGISIVLWLSSSFGLEPSQKWQEESILYERIVSFSPIMVHYLTAFIPNVEGLFENIKNLLTNDKPQ